MYVNFEGHDYNFMNIDMYKIPFAHEMSSIHHFTLSFHIDGGSNQKKKRMATQERGASCDNASPAFSPKGQPHLLVICAFLSLHPLERVLWNFGLWTQENH
ncbi:hypothetical protein ACJX0J_033984, partial [Zea mays]